MEFRAFRNSDPPLLAEIWRSQPPKRGLMQPMSADLLDEHVLSKPYFDREGLQVAVRDGEPVGFVHASFGPNDNESELSTRWGVTCLVMVRANLQRQGIGVELLARSESYLKSRGAEVLYAGGIRPLNAFYLGLYGGSELPGVLVSDERAVSLFRGQGYEEIDRTVVFQRDVASFRTQVDRQQVHIRRRYAVHVVEDPAPESWWEACTLGTLDRTRLELVPREGGPASARASFWDMQPLAASWGVHAAGLIELEVADSSRRQGLATFLIAESFRLLQSRRVSLVEVQTMQHNAAAICLYEKLGFARVDQGLVLRKNDSASKH